MTRKLYEEDPYLIEFEATVERLDGEWVRLDRTALFPGGGGQDRDRGTIGGLEVVESRTREGVEHRVPGHAFGPGDKVRGAVDWPHRYGMMRAHTGEHMLFSALSRRVEMELVKISLTPGKRSLVVKGEVTWEVIKEALEEVNGAVLRGEEVKFEVLSKSDIDQGRTRVKIDRIHGDAVRVVSIGDFDEAACTGVHVRNTREIGLVLVTKFTSARPAGDWEIEFQVGEEAASSAVQLSVELLMASDTIGSHPRDFRTALENREADHRLCREALKQYSKAMLSALEPADVAGMKVYSGSFLGIDRKVLMDKANEMVAGNNTMAILVQESDRSFLVIARSPDLDIDCVRMLNETLSEHGGRGGGKPFFATGGTPGPVEGKMLVRKALDMLGVV